MDNTGKNYKEYLEAAYRAALKAGAEILEVYESGDFDVEKKGDDSPLTRADRRAHDAIAAELEQTGIPLLSEEGADIPNSSRGEWELYWLIDPLDGTKEFIKRNGEFTVNIALMAPASSAGEAAAAGSRPPAGSGPDGHVPVAGIVYVPVKETMYAGIDGEGAWKIEVSPSQPAQHMPVQELQDQDSPAQPVSLEDQNSRLHTLSSQNQAARPLPVQNPAGRPFSAVMSRSHNSPETEAVVAEMEKSYGPAERVSSGSSIKLCLVAEGAADVYPRFAPTMEWDTAAGDAVCRAAGCRVTEKDGRTPLVYNKEDLHNPWFLVLGPTIEAPA